MPPRIPESTKRLRGTARRDRAPGKQRQTPKPAAKSASPSPAAPQAPSAPRGTLWTIPLSPPPGSGLDARVWQECAHAVNELRCATSADAVAFHELVRALALLRTAAAELEASGFTYVAASGARKASPAVSAWATASKTAGALLDRFGMSPACRERVAEVSSAEEKYKDDEVARFLFGPRERKLPPPWKPPEQTPASLPGERDP
jgi:P27 family predicted phage terminase small subunit